MGKFFPEGIRPSVSYYSNFFSALEIDSTYYSIPTRDSFQSSLKKIDRSLKISVKLPSSVTHFGLPEQRKESMKLFVENVADPLFHRDSGSLMLFTIPPWIGKSNMEKYLHEMKEVTMEAGHIYAELRNFSEDLFEMTRNILEKLDFGISFTDNYLNHLRLMETGERIVYIRLHGRNPDFSRPDTGMNKFNYLYSKLELETIGKEIRRMEKQFESVYIFFNNHPNGNAPVNAMELGRILGQSKMGFL